MKKLLYYFSVMALLLAVCSCQDDEQALKASLKVAPGTVDLPKEGGSQIIAVITNQGNVIARGYDESWCKVTIDGKVMTIEATANTARFERTTDIVVVAGNDDNLAKKVITVTQEVDALNYLIMIPEDFSTGLVQKVMDGELQVAEICNEYVAQFSQTKRATVIYPMNADGKANLKKGYVIENGGTLEWDKEAITHTYTPGLLTVPLVKVYMNGSKFSSEAESSNQVATEITPYTINDGDNNFYRVVKVGSQYWAAENLRTTKYIDGTPIGQGTPADWMAGNSGLYTWIKNSNLDVAASEDLKRLYGAHYNWHAINTGMLAPQGWRVPTDTDNTNTYWKTGVDFFYLLRTLGGSAASTVLGVRLKSELAAASSAQTNYSIGEWAYTSDNAAKGNNISGMTLIPAGLYFPDSDAYNYVGQYAMLWSATTTASNSAQATLRRIENARGGVYVFSMIKNNGYSIRLVRGD